MTPISLSAILQHLAATDQSDDDGVWLEMMTEDVSQYSLWALVVLDPKTFKNAKNGLRDDPENVAEMAHIGLDNLPPIVVIPIKGRKYKWHVVDGTPDDRRQAHRKLRVIKRHVD